MSTQRLLPAITGPQNFENFLEVLVNPEKYKKQYEALTEQAALIAERVAQVGKAKDIESLLKQAKASERDMKAALEAGLLKAQGMINEAEGVVAALYTDFEEVEATFKKERHEHEVAHAAGLVDLERREAAVQVEREAATEKLARAEALLARAKKTQAEYEAKAKALGAAMAA